MERTFENLRLESWISGQNKAENAKFSNNFNGGGGAHERRIDGKFRERRQAWKKMKKKVMTAAHPRTTFQCECPWGIYLHLLEINNKLLCPYLIDSDAVFWSYCTRFKTNKAKICAAYYGPIFVFCAKFLMLPFLLNLSFFVHWNIMKFCPGCQLAPRCMK